MKILFAFAALLCAASGVYAQGVTVFAAASLTNALNDINAAYTAKSGVNVRVSYAASSTLAKQIESGAPADLFFSADEPWMDVIEKAGLVASGTRRSLLTNRLVIVAPSDSRAAPLHIAPGFDLAGALAGGRLATGDPAHVPVGRYAQQALSRLGVWAAIEPRLARADNVRAALALVERGEAPLGIVYATDATLAPRVRVVGVFPSDSHAPISYPLAVIAKRDRPEVLAYQRHLLGREAGEVFRRYGFAAD